MKQESRLTRHLRDANETYLQHLGFTLKVAATLMGIALVALIHGLLPFLFTHTASAMLAGLTTTMQARKTACEARQDAQSSDSL